MLWWIVLIATMVLGGIGQAWVSSAYKKWGQVQSSIPMTGAEVARAMLAEKGERDVQINVIAGNLTDNFDPKTKTLNLSSDVANGTSVAAHAIACHEAGHYQQFCEGYALMKLRHVLVPITNFASQACWIILMIGIFIGSLGMVWVAAGCYAIAFIFALVTLPVEINASKRAIAYLDGNQQGLLGSYQVAQSEREGSRAMLKAAGSTYLFAVIASALNLLYILAIARG